MYHTWRPGHSYQLCEAKGHRQTTEHLISLDYSRKDYDDMITKQQVSFDFGCI